ncbi:MAG: redoxin domain-containing protein [Verrucomicrobia bacterium]|nr:redoxin domain-containing protein [Verrucomicrobiota bacterium]
MKRWACMWVALVACAGLRAADSTNAPPSEAAVPGAVLASKPGDSAAEVLGLRRIRDTLARRPADDGGDALKDWLIAVVVRCEHYLGDQPGSSHVAEVRAVDAQCRQELAALTGERAERDKAVQLARQSLAKNDRGPGAARARLVLARVAWPEELGAVIEQARLIVRDFSDQPPAAEAFWLLARAQQRKGDERAVREAAIGLFGAFPKSREAAQARALLQQLSLYAQPAPLPAVTTADGKALDLGAVRNQALVLDFWTAATLPAGESSGVLRRLFEVHRDSGLLVVGINLDTDRATFDKANAAHPTPWPQVFANDPANAKLMEAYPAMAPPTRVLVDPSGIVARIAAHPAEIEPLMKRWQSTGALASSAAAAPAKPAAPVRPSVRTAARTATVVSKREAPKPAVAKTPAPEKRSVAVAKLPSKPTAVPAPEKRVVATPAPPPPPAPAPQPTHIEIGGVLYAKPLRPAIAMPVESTKPTVKVPPSVAVASPRPPPPAAKPFATTEKPAKLDRAPAVAPSEPTEPAVAAAKPPSPVAKSFASAGKPARLGRTSATAPKEPTEPVVSATKPPSPAAKRFASEEKPAKLSRPTVTASKKPDSEPKPSSTPPATPPKPRSGYGSSTAKAKLKTESSESLATMPDISESDRKAALVDAAKRILKSEEELITWSELESLFTTKKPASAEGSLVWYQDVADRCQQFIKEFPKSPRVNLVRINEARCRLSVFQMTKDFAQRSRAETAAHEVLAHKPNEDDAIRAEFLLLNATWPDHPEQGVAIAKRIAKDFPHRRETAAAMLMHAQFRRRQAMLHAAKEAAADLLKRFPESEFVFNARSLMRQCDLLNNPCPPAKFTGLRGEKMDIAAMKGKPLLIEFWSAKSKNVLEDAAKLVQLYLRYHPKGFEIYTICVDKSREALDIFQLSHPLPWPVYWDGQGYQGPLCEQFGVDTAPMRFMLEPGLQRIGSTHLSPEGVAAALNLWIDQNQPPLLPGQEPPVQGFFQKFFGLKF